MNCDYIYEDYNDYDKLSEEYSTPLSFYNAISGELTSMNLSWLSSDATLLNKIKTLASVLSYPIYDEYYNDKIGYAEKETFVKRLTNTLVRKVNRWYIQKQIEQDLIDNATLEKFISNGGTTSSTNENASTGSAVIQKSASTPTGITHSTDAEAVTMALVEDTENDTTNLNVTDGYQDKYTNFVGKTNGLHRNEVERDTEIKRSSNYGLAMDIIDKIPFSYINDVLREVSQHFIQIY